MDAALAGAAGSSPSSRASSPGGRRRPPQRHYLVATPLYTFQLPPTLMDSIQLRSIDVEEPKQISKPVQNTNDTAASGPPSRSTGLTCAVCPSHPTFESSGHQRAHFRSEWHRYNLQVSLKSGSESKALVDESGWEQLVNDLGEPTDEEDASLDTDGEVKKPQDLVGLVMNKLHLTGSGSRMQADEDSYDEADEDDLTVDGRHARHSVAAKSPFLWFNTPEENIDNPVKQYIQQTQVGIYRSLFPHPAEPVVQDLNATTASEWHTRALKAMQVPTLRRSPARGNADPSAWRGKRLKGMHEAARILGMQFLEGEGYLPGISTAMTNPRVPKDAQDDGDESTESDDQLSSSSSESETDDTASQATQPARTTSPADPRLKIWTIILYGGGNFAIAVVALNPHIAPRPPSKARPLPAHGSDKEIIQEERSLIVLAHKSFHRYTTRKKQGGSQSAQDASGKFAKSAGAQLRRYGEAALAQEVRALLALSGYRKLIADSERIYVRADPRAARGVLWTWPGISPPSLPNASPLEAPRVDGRIRSIPVATRPKAIVAECLRAFAELVKVKVSHRPEQVLQDEDEAYRKSLEGDQAARVELKKRRQREKEEREDALRQSHERAQQRKQSIAVLDENETKQRKRLVKLIDMVQRGNVNAIAKQLSRHPRLLVSPEGTSVHASLPEWWRSQDLSRRSRRVTAPLIPSTLLHVAAEAGQADVIQWLLTEMNADPTVGIPPPPPSPTDETNAEEQQQRESASWPHRTAYDLISSSDKAARNVFRKLYAQQPDLFNWGGTEAGGARVDSPLTEEMESNQSRRRANMREKARAREKEREARQASARVAEEEQTTPTSEPPAPTSHETRNRLGGPGQSAPRVLRESKDRMEGVTPEMRMRIEREKRARAAEERMKKLQGGGGT